MPVNVIGTLKPKNNGKFPVVEAVDIKVTDDLRLDKALENKADLSTVNFALDNKADKTTTSSLQEQINQIVISSSAEAVVAPEVAAARVDYYGKTYNTLKARIDAIDLNSSNIESNLSEFQAEIANTKYTIISGVVEDKKYINASGIVVSTSGETNVIETINVTEGDELYIDAGAGWGSCYYSIQNDNGDVLDKKNSPSDDTSHTITDYKVVIPPDGTKLIISKFLVTVYGAKKISGYELKDAYKINQSYDLLADYWINSGTFELQKYITPAGVVVSTPSDAYTVATIAVESGEIYLIRGTANFGNSFYSIVDDNGNVIDKELSENSDTLQAYEATITIPANAAYLNVSGVYSGFFCKKKIKVISDTKPFINKKWACMGDSLTEKNARTNLHYYDYIVDSTGIEVVNLGISGSGYMNGAGSNKQFYNRVDSIPLDSDVVTIFGSGNDNQLPLGNVSDTGTETVCGCINTTIENIIARIPTVSLGIVSPTPWESYPPFMSNNNKMKEMVNAMKEICERRSIPFLDLYHCSNLRPWTEEGKAACYTKDNGSGVHPDETGHKLIAPRFKAFLDNLIL